MSANTRRYKRRRRNRTPLFLLLLLLVTGMVLLLISCGGKDGENPGDSNDPIQGGAADPGEGGYRYCRRSRWSRSRTPTRATPSAP